MKIQNEKVIFNRFHQIILLETEMKGKKVTREKLVLKNAVAAIVIDEKNRIGLVRQFRPTINAHIWELPAGVLDKPHLTPLETLLEELEEECAISDNQVLSYTEKPIRKYYSLVGSSDAQISLYIIHVSEQENKVIEDADVDEVRWFTLAEIRELERENHIVDGKTLIGYHIFKDMISKTSESESRETFDYDSLNLIKKLKEIEMSKNQDFKMI